MIDRERRDPGRPFGERVPSERTGTPARSKQRAPVKRPFWYSASIFQIDALMPGESMFSVVTPSVANQVRGPWSLPAS